MCLYNQSFAAISGDTIPIFSLPFPGSAGAAGREAARQLLFKPRRADTLLSKVPVHTLIPRPRLRAGLAACRPG
jgi:hypothetical protein